MSHSSALKRPSAPLPVAPTGELGTAVERERRRGRGASSNSSGRYESLARVAFDDGWQGLEDLPPFKTTVTVDST
ncbi:MAG TPA: radical SAM protein, partial [Xanthobacteraceae bacterium]